MSADSEKIIDIYQRHAQTWAQARRQESTLYERSWLDRFSALIPPGQSILDVGCGPGEPIATYLAQCGHAVTGVDSSPAMIAMFQQRLPSQHALVADMRTLALAETFHGILAWDSFFHLDHKAQRNMFPIFRAHAAPCAPLMFTSGPAHGEVIGQLEGDPLFHSSLDPTDYHDLLDRHGFTVVAHVVADPACFGRTIWLAQLRP
ncbi:MAG: class I SAM-dependent methyltransferase [Acidobacteriaceae bacterium]